jgi:hypothetical protein
MRAFASIVFALTACGGLGGSTDVKPTLVFADRSDTEIARLVSAAGGTDGFAAQAQAMQFDPFGGQADPCPTIAEDAVARRVTITGGCTTQEGTAIEGSVVLDNPLGWDELDYDFNHASVFTYDGFALTTGGNRMAIDGTLSQKPGFTTLDMDLTTEQLGVTVRSDLHMECGGSSCQIGNSGLELGDAGGVLVSGGVTVGSGQTETAHFTLRGVDTVKVEIKNNCVAWSLDGTDRGTACAP